MVGSTARQINPRAPRNPRTVHAVCSLAAAAAYRKGGGLRIVLDTNVVLSVVVFHDERFDGLVRAWRSGAVVPLVDEHTVAELERVLAYPQFAHRFAGREAALSEYVPYTERVDTAGHGAGLVRCRDPDDQKFLVLAHAGRAATLVTSDALLLGVRRRVGFAIETPKTFIARLAAAA
jgi:putative PIN family toxin of toxin-antitoxin system